MWKGQTMKKYVQLFSVVLLFFLAAGFTNPVSKKSAEVPVTECAKIEPQKDIVEIKETTVTTEKEDLSSYFEELSIYPVDINEMLSPDAKKALAHYVDNNCKSAMSASVKLIEFLGTDITEEDNEICLHFIFGKDQYRCIYINTETGDIDELYSCVLTESIIMHWNEI